MKTDIIVVFDRSGSMHAIKDDMEGGFAQFLQEQKTQEGEAAVTLVQFDDIYEVIYTAKPIADVPEYKLTPRNSTALLDALGRTINTTGERLAAMCETTRPDKVIFVIVTDGLENASREFTRDRIFEMIKHQREVYNWEFVYVGANQDAIAESGKLGIAACSTRNYENTSEGTKLMWNSVSRGMSNYRKGNNEYKFED